MENKSKLTSTSSINALTNNISQLSLSFEIPYNQLKVGKLLGEGGFGLVYQATYLHADVAFKQLKSKKLGEQAQEEWIKETQVMAQLRSPFIVQLYGITTEPGQYGMVMEYLPKGSLWDLLQSKTSLDWIMRYQIGLDVGKGVTFLHAHQIIHRDLKSLNVLLDNQYRAKLCDFGLAKVKILSRSSSTDTNTSVGTLEWMAPELFKRKAVYSFASDMYSYGMVLWEIASRRTPFEDAQGNQTLIMQWVSNGEREEIPEETPASIKEAIEACWYAAPDKRPTASQVVEQLHSGFETLQLQSLPKYPASASNSVSFKQTVTSGPQYLDNFASQSKISPIISGPQYLPNSGIIVTSDLKASLPNSQSGVLNKTIPSKPMILSRSESVKATFPVLDLKDTPENLVQAAQALIRGRNWTFAQKAYFQNLMETLSLPPTQKLVEDVEDNEYINCFLLLPNEEVVSGSLNDTLKVWNMKTGVCMKTLTGHEGPVNCLLLLPSGEVVSGSWDKTLKVWNIKTGMCVKTLTGHEDDVNCLLLLPSGEVVSGSRDKTLKVWNIKTDMCVKTLTGHEEAVNCLLLLPSGEVMSGSGSFYVAQDNTLKLWNIKTGMCVKTLTGHAGPVRNLLLLPNGKVVSASGDKTLKVWDMKTSECVKTLTGHSGIIQALRLVSNTCFVSRTNGEIKRWNISNYTCEHTCVGLTAAITDLLPLSATECLVATPHALQRITWQPYILLSQALSEPTLSLTASNYGFFKGSLKRQGKRLPRTLMGHSSTIYSLLLLPSGEVISGSDDKTLKVWDIKTGQCMKTLAEHTSSVTSLLLLPSGNVLSSSRDSALKVWDIKKSKCVKTLVGHKAEATSLLLLPNGEVVMSRFWDHELEVWDIKAGQCIKKLEGHSSSVNCLLLLPSGEVVSGSSDKTLKVWNMKTGKCVKTLTGHEDSVNCLLLLPSGEVVSGSEDKTIKVWNIRTGQCVKTLADQSDKITSLLLLPSGEVIRGSSDNTLKVWNMETGECMKTLIGHSGGVYSLLLLPSGEVVSGSSDGTLKVWDIHLEKTLEELETQAPECKQM